MLRNRDGYGPDGRRRYFFDLGSDAPPPPDYTPVANASKESAQIMADLGQKQIAESQRQYDNNMKVVQPVVDAQLGIMKQTADQGADYFDYMKNNQRPVETALNNRAMTDTSSTDTAARAGVTQAQTAAADNLKTGANTIKTVSENDANAIKNSSIDLASELGTRTGAISTGLNTAAEGIGRDLRTGAGDISGNLVSGVQRVGSNLTAGAGTIANDLTTGTGQEAQKLTDTASTVAGGIRDQSTGYENKIGGNIDLITGGNQGIYDKYGADIEGDVGKAVADARAGQTSAANTALRQALRYGASVPVTTGAMAIANAQQLAAAANGARTAGIDKARANLGTGVNMEQNLFQTAGGQKVAAGNIEADAGKAVLGTNAAALDSAAKVKAGALSDASAMETDALKSGAGIEAGALSKTADLQSTAHSQGAALDANALTTGTALRDSGLRSAIDLEQSGVKDNINLTQAGLNADAAAASTARDMGIADDARATGKLMDVAGLYRNLPGASTGAYSVANTAGNSAVNNSIAPGNQLLTGMNQGANITGTGQQLQLSGLSNVLNNQTSYTNSITNKPSDLSGLGSVLGGAAALYPVIAGSSKDIKTDKQPISDDAALAGISRIPVDKEPAPENTAMAGLQRIPVEKWTYKSGEGDGGTHVGPYAEDVQQEFGDQAAPGGKAIDLVSMNGITIAALKGLEKKVAGLERIVKKGGNVIEGDFSVVDGSRGGGRPVLPHVGLVRMEA